MNQTHRYILVTEKACRQAWAKNSKAKEKMNQQARSSRWNEGESSCVVKLSSIAASVYTSLTSKLRLSQQHLPLAQSHHAVIEPNMTLTTRTDWAARVRAAMELFNEERHNLCEVEVRALLAYPELPQYYHVQCLVILASCVKNWSEGKVSGSSH